MKYREQQELVRDLRAMADFFEQPTSIVLPKPWLSFHESVREGEWTHVDGKSEFIYNIEASHSKLQSFIRALSKGAKVGEVSKNWGNADLSVVRKFGKAKLTFSVDRQIVCKKVVKSVKLVPKREYVEVPGEFTKEEEVEWICEDPSLLS